MYKHSLVTWSASAVLAAVFFNLMLATLCRLASVWRSCASVDTAAKTIWRPTLAAASPASTVHGNARLLGRSFKMRRPFCSNESINDCLWLENVRWRDILSWIEAAMLDFSQTIRLPLVTGVFYSMQAIDSVGLWRSVQANRSRRSYFHLIVPTQIQPNKTQNARTTCIMQQKGCKWSGFLMTRLHAFATTIAIALSV